ncbi:MAG: zinc ribbon domain-containing protein [bacterium]|nr:zinc ribbon domain-containing protein [bacterium]
MDYPNPTPATISQFCPYCQFPLISAYSFCPSCGKPLKPQPLETGPLKQAIIYVVSFFLPPFGLGWGFKYLRQEGDQAKRIGLIAIILTFVSLILALWITVNIMSSVSQALSGQTDLEKLTY